MSTWTFPSASGSPRSHRTVADRILEDSDLTPQQVEEVLQLRQQYLLSSVGILLCSLVALAQLVLTS